MKGNLLVIAFTIISLSACDYTTEVSEDLTQEPYFDLPSLVQQQLDRLDSLQPSVEVVAKINNQEEKEKVKKDSTGWAETLKLFSDADINRPVLQGSYIVSDSTDQQHHWSVRTYRAKQPQEVEVPYLTVYYQDSLTNVRRIETKFHEENLLYSTSRQLEMQFEPTNSGPRLVGYRSEGRQKMILRDSVHYQLQATLQYL
uniref:Lipoprotein n=1 Tax=Roseihalotalea indica TaxID=2867963 RepID=A0AA49GPU8_9BACT|nr:hypothetical protein K4G66_06300 [Tunicatimonas sp. TK19036]